MRFTRAVAAFWYNTTKLSPANTAATENLVMFSARAIDLTALLAAKTRTNNHAWELMELAWQIPASSDDKVVALASNIELPVGIDADFIVAKYQKAYPELHWRTAPFNPSGGEWSTGSEFSGIGRLDALGTIDSGDEHGLILVATTKFGAGARKIYKIAWTDNHRARHLASASRDMASYWKTSELSKLGSTDASELVQYHLLRAQKFMDANSGEGETEAARIVATLWAIQQELAPNDLQQMKDIEKAIVARREARLSAARRRALEEARLKEAEQAEQFRRSEAAIAAAKTAAIQRAEYLKRMSDPKIQVPKRLCSTLAQLRFYESLLYREQMIEREGGVSDLTARRLLGTQIFESKEAIVGLAAKFGAVFGRPFEESSDCD